MSNFSRARLPTLTGDALLSRDNVHDQNPFGFDKMNRASDLDRRFVSTRGNVDTDNISAFKRSFNHNLYFSYLKDRTLASPKDYFMATASLVRDNMVLRYLRTQQRYFDLDVKRVYYISTEYSLGRLLSNSVINLGLKNMEETLYDLGLAYEEIEEAESDLNLGNGGLGRLAACFLDSMATLGIAAQGFGLRYDFGLFAQRIQKGIQTEELDDWLEYGNPWERINPEYSVPVKFYGKVEKNKELGFRWINTETVMAVPYDILIPGHHNNIINTLRLWSAKAPTIFKSQFKNCGDYVKAVFERNNAENITKFLYPNDQYFDGKEFTLKQEYFLAAASVADIIRQYKCQNYGEREVLRRSFDQFPNKVAIHLNGSHPTLVIPELMRVFIDEEQIAWNAAWEMVKRCCTYTIHNIEVSSLERWPVKLLQTLLPRHMSIIFEINTKLLSEIERKWPGDKAKQGQMSIIEEGGEKQVNMSHLCLVSCQSVNGVSAVHSELLRKQMFRDFYEMYPFKFNNKTNGVSPRRWLQTCNQPLTDFICDKIGLSWQTQLEELHNLRKFVKDTEFLNQFRKAKDHNKNMLTNFIQNKYKIAIDPSSMFDVHARRIDDNKRQILTILHVITLYNRLKKNPEKAVPARTVIMAGKASPGNQMAKQIIRLFFSVAKKINADNVTNKKLKCVFVENYGVTMAEKIIPAADLSEQLSLAGTEASGTANMKFMMNGALTLGTLGGSNIEICAEIGSDNFFQFGLTIEQVEERRKGYNPKDCYERNSELRQCVDQIERGIFSPENLKLFKDISTDLLQKDKYMVLADYESYMKAQDKIGDLFKKLSSWDVIAATGVACSGKFSSDRSVSEYAQHIWKVETRRDRLTAPYDCWQKEQDAIENGLTTYMQPLAAAPQKLVKFGGMPK